MTNPTHRVSHTPPMRPPGRRDKRGGAAAPTRADFPFLLPPVEPDEIGRLGMYRVLRLLGDGGMGYVFAAEDLALGRPVALKVMKPDLGRDVCGAQRFLREARIMAAIKHESVVTLFQIAQEQDVIFLAMELLAGVSLEEWLERVPQTDVPTILRIGQEIAGGLAAIHEAGLVHRDIKPGNLWVEEPAGRIKILDFGLARIVKDDQLLTPFGTVIGTPYYMSPEQSRGEQADFRSDLFSFGCVLYRLCTGTIPFQGRNHTECLAALALEEPLSVDQVNPKVPRSLSGLVLQLLEKEPEDRPSSARAVLARLRKIEASRHSGAAAPARPAQGPSAKRRGTRSSGRRKRPASRGRWLFRCLALLLGLTVGIAVAYLVRAGLRAGDLIPAQPPAEAGR